MQEHGIYDCLNEILGILCNCSLIIKIECEYCITVLIVLVKVGKAELTAKLFRVKLMLWTSRVTN